MDMDEIERSVAAAGFIFRGCVAHHWKGHVPAVPGDGEIVAMRIEHVLRSAATLRGLAGHDALVISGHADALRHGDSSILFTDVISVGEELLLREISHVRNSEGAGRHVAEAIDKAERRPLHERVAEAELIVAGEVVRNEPLEIARKPKGEHDPIWWLAHVAVKAVHKGHKPRGEIAVLFASSIDRAWVASPKLFAGTSGILLLRHVKGDELPEEVPRTAYEATHPLDLQPAGKLADIERALGGDSGG